jgi:CBS domain-containing protein
VKNIKQVLDSKGYVLHSIGPGASVYEALQKMANAEIGALVVLDGAELVGILSERDYARKVILKGRDSRDTPVSEIMTPDVVCVTSAMRVDACMSVMTEKRMRHLVVRDDERLSGVVSIGDVVKAIIEDQKFTIEQLEHYITNGR